MKSGDWVMVGFFLLIVFGAAVWLAVSWQTCVNDGLSTLTCLNVVFD